jgi:hypothetical protein
MFCLHELIVYALLQASQHTSKVFFAARYLDLDKPCSVRRIITAETRNLYLFGTPEKKVIGPTFSADLVIASSQRDLQIQRTMPIEIESIFIQYQLTLQVKLSYLDRSSQTPLWSSSIKN